MIVEHKAALRGWRKLRKECVLENKKVEIKT
jgi:hypothetical protein